jgi:hypothetical protein
MKASGCMRYIGPAAVLLAFSTQTAPAATLGTIEFERFTNATSSFITDLGGGSAGIADANVTLNQFNGAPTLTNGLPDRYDIHVDRTFLGDRNSGTADAIDDRYLFQVDSSTLNGAPSTRASATLTLVTGVNTGMENVSFALFESDSSGNPVGSALASGSDGTLKTTLSAGVSYLLQVAGNLGFGNGATNVGRYDIVYGTVIPVPPALLLFLTALGAGFGLRRLRRDEASA